jgi:hypothetical protein
MTGHGYTSSASAKDGHTLMGFSDGVNAQPEHVNPETLRDQQRNLTRRQGTGT